MRLGGPIFGDYSEPEQWVRLVQSAGYRAVYCPKLQNPTDEAEVRAFADAAEKAGIVISEVGAWSNPMSSDADERQKAITKCKESLSLADRIGARCCVNISGSKGKKWDGPHEDNLTDATFNEIVETTRDVIDSVAPTRTFWTLEMMPWMYPDGPESYLRLLRAIDRPQFAVHLDIVNIVSSPRRYFNNADLTRECFALLGPFLKGVHAKDIRLADTLTVHLDEVRPGLGGFDFRVLLTEMSALPGDMPLMLEHLPNETEYTLAAQFVRETARDMGLSV